MLEFGPDGCFGIDVRDDERGLATMKNLGLEERKFITLQLRTNTAKIPGVHGSWRSERSGLQEVSVGRRYASYQRLLCSSFSLPCGRHCASV